MKKEEHRVATSDVADVFNDVDERCPETKFTQPRRQS